jgi:hypothetical protein
MQLRTTLNGRRRDYVAGPLAAARGAAAADAARLAEACEGEQAIDPSDLPALRSAVEAVRAAAEEDPVQLGWLEDVEAVLDRTEALAADGVWIPEFRPGLPGWRLQAASYEILPHEGSTHGADGGSGVSMIGLTPITYPFLSPLGRLPEPFYVTARFEPRPLRALKYVPKVGVGLGPGVFGLVNRKNASTEKPSGPATGGYHLFAPGMREKTQYELENEGLTSNNPYDVMPDTTPPGQYRSGWLTTPWVHGLGSLVPGGDLPAETERIRLATLAEAGRVATFTNGQKQFEADDPETAPAAVQPVRLGVLNEAFNSGEVRIDSLRIEYRPKFTPPAD